MPSLGTILGWIGDKDHPLSEIYPRAKALLIPLFEERMALSAIDPERFVIVTRRQVLNRDGDVVNVVEEKEVDNVQRSALKMEAYKWTLGHLQPKKHGKQSQPDADKPNEQLEALYQSLRAGPKE